ncbi:MAG: Heme exporter protein [Hyphomicrobiales bacterium]|nr:Heme exporter protein [Hyphomicrobiales bacterium]
MIDPNSENIFIAWAYAGVVVAVLGLIAWTYLDTRRIAARLKRLEDQGIHRRSAGKAS